MTIKKVIAISILLGSTIFNSIGVSATTPPKNWESKWWNDGTNFTYIKDNKPVIGLQNIKNELYYFDNNGYLKYGWIQYNNEWLYATISRGEILHNCWENIGNKWYYFNQDGVMAHNTYINGYYVDSNGVWAK